MALNVYYLDDELGLCENFEDWFSSADVNVKTFTDAQNAIDAIRAHPPDILFIDYRLVGTTGDVVAQSLNANFPIYLVTGDISAKTTFEFKKVILKPYSEKEIFGILEALAGSSV